MIKKEEIKELQKYFSTFDEGYGTGYERYALNNFICQMIERYSISSVLEMPVNGVMGIPGINSLMFAKQGCEVTVAHPSKDFLDNAKRIWDAFGLDANFVKSNWIDSKFDENKFDLVWNFCVYGHFEDPEKVVGEMLRVSRKCIFIEFQNIVNPGFRIHRLQHFLKKESWDHGDPTKLRFSNVRRTIEGLKGVCVEVGGIDMPPWPDIPVMLKPGGKKELTSELGPKTELWDINKIIKEVSSSETSANDELLLRLFELWYSWIESKAPLLLKKFYAHHRYIIAEKRR